MQIKSTIKYLFLFLSLVTFLGCRDNIVPKPRGHFRIDMPPKAYRLYDTVCPFVFEYPVYGRISTDVGQIKKPCWFNIEFPRYKAIIHVSYNQIHNNLESVLKESYDFTYAHSIKADAITEQPWQNAENKVYGILYDIKGNTASSIQFFVTDSSRNFLRGALYFTVQPDADSLAPVIEFFRKDIVHMVETFKWK